MTTPTNSVREALTDEQIAEQLAVKLMGLTRGSAHEFSGDMWIAPDGLAVYTAKSSGDRTRQGWRHWNPANNIEQAFLIQDAMSDDLYYRYIDCLLEQAGTGSNDAPYAARASARARCLAAIAALLPERGEG